MRIIERTSQFKILSAWESVGKDMRKFKEVLQTLVEGEQLAQYRDHLLLGQYTGLRKCHIEPDWLCVRSHGHSMTVHVICSG